MSLSSGKQLQELLLAHLPACTAVTEVCRVVAQQVSSAWGCTVAVVVAAQAETGHGYGVWVRNAQGGELEGQWPEDERWSEWLRQGEFGRFAAESADLPPALHPLTPAGASLIPLPLSPVRQSFPACLCLAHPLPPAIGAAEVQQLATLITPWLDRSLLQRQVVQQQQNFDLINSISLSLTATLSLEEIFDKVTNPVRHTLDAESVSIGLVEAESGDIVFFPELLGPRFHNLPGIRVKKGEGVAGWVAHTGQTALVNDAYNDARFYSGADALSGFRTQTLLCVPLSTENRVIGVVEAVNKKNGRFSKGDLALLQAMASPLAIALENARLHGVVLAEKRRIETLFNQMSEGICTINPDGIITSCNQSLLTLLEAESADITGTLLAKTIPLDNRHALSQFLDRLWRTPGENRTFPCALRLPGQAAPTPVLISGVCIPPESDLPGEALLVFSDLRPIHELERMREDFFINIIHELRTPLATILMYARLLKAQFQHRDGDEKSRAQHFVEMIQKASDQLQHMVRDQLALARLKSTTLQSSRKPLSVTDLLHEILEPLREQARSNAVSLHATIAPDLWLPLANAEFLESAFKNVIENAIKFSPGGAVQVEAWREENNLYLEVQDNGIGIPREALPNLFKRFYRAETAVAHGIAGTGLGLAMARESIEHHGGSIHVRSGVDKGTTFFIRLPL